MAKRGKLSKIETCFIENNREKTVAEIALELDRTEAAVQKHLDTLPEVEVVQEEKTTETTAPVFDDNGNPMRKVIGFRTAEQKRKGVAIWNAAASQVAESTRDSRIGKANRFTKDAIHQPFGDGYETPKHDPSE